MLRQLHLEPPLSGARALGEDVQDQRGTIDHLHAAEGILQVALLRRRKLVVKDEGIHLFRSPGLLELLDFAFADVNLGRLVQPLDRRANDDGARCTGKLRQLSQRVLGTQNAGAPPELGAYQVRPFRSGSGGNKLLGYVLILFWSL